MHNRAKVKRSATAWLPTRFGKFQIHVFVTADRREHAVLQMGRVVGNRPVLIRVHSQCLTGDTFWSLKCDCHAQLQAALKKIARARQGLLVYLNQEGRGIGLVNKIRAYALQDQGLDTVEANLALGFAPDARDYRDAAAILKQLKAQRIRLLTNNPEKIHQLTKFGIIVTEQISLTVGKSRTNRHYLKVKAQKLGHRLPG